MEYSEKNLVILFFTFLWFTPRAEKTSYRLSFLATEGGVQKYDVRNIRIRLASRLEFSSLENLQFNYLLTCHAAIPSNIYNQFRQVLLTY